jgi:hypothetical protein
MSAPRLALSDLTLTAVQAEATRAHLRHGRNSMLYQDTTNERRLAILAEEVGEVARALNEYAITGALDETNLEKELIQVAAMAASWVEAINS